MLTTLDVASTASSESEEEEEEADFSAARLVVASEVKLMGLRRLMPATLEYTAEAMASLGQSKPSVPARSMARLHARTSAWAILTRDLGPRSFTSR